MSLMKLSISIVLIGLTFTGNAFQSDAERYLSVQLTEAVREVNMTVPMTLDEGTRLDSAATYSNYMIYNNTMLNYTAEQLDVNKFYQIVQENVIANLCANKELAPFIELGVIMVYRYLGKNGQFITELSLDMSSCKKTE